MKISPKTKNIKKITKTVSKRKSSAVQLAHTNHPILRHLRLINAKHTGKLIHHRHTSHLALVIIMAFAGVFLFINQSFVAAQQQSETGTVAVGAVVPGKQLAIGATILLPVDKAIINKLTYNVSGSCAPQSYVIIYDNGVAAGSAACTSEGIFSLEIQSYEGYNALQTMNYDGMNRPGPDTPIVTVKVELPDLSISSQLMPVTANPVSTDKLENPAIIPGITPSRRQCYDYDGNVDKSLGGSVEIAVVCVVRGLQPGEQSAIGVTLHGGQPPYAIAVNMGEGGNENNTLISMPNPGYKVVPVVYSDPGRYTVKIQAKDSAGQIAITQTVIEVNGVVGLNTFASVKDTALNTSWLQTPLPLYIIALALTIGFWIGDIFNRHFGIRRVNKLNQKKSS